MALRLRALEVGEILDHALELYRRNLPTFLGIYAVTAVPYVALATPLMMRSLAAGPASEALVTLGAGLALLVVYTVVLSPLASGALTIAVSQRFLGRPASLVAAYRRVGRQAGPLIACLGLLAIPLFGALLAAMVVVVLLAVWLDRLVGGAGVTTTVLAGVLFGPVMALIVLLHTTLFGFVPAAAVLEERRFGSLWRSLELAWPNRWRVFGVLFVLTAMVVLAAAYVRLPTQLLTGAAGLGGQATTHLLGALGMQVAIMLVDPLRLVGVTLLYYDLRVRREGLDVSLLASELEPAVKPPRPSSPGAAADIP